MAQKKKLKKKRDLISIVVALIALVVFCYSGYQIISIILEENQVKTDYKNIISIVDVTPDIPDDEEEIQKAIALNKKSFNELRAINSDFIGWLSFDSGLVSQPIVQTTDNEYYLTHSFFKKKSAIGTAFMDYSHTMSYANLTIYGHYVYSNPSLMFTPLERMIDQKYYEANKYFSFTTSTERIEYEIVAVFHYDINADGNTIPFMVGELTGPQLVDYVNAAKAKAFYDTGITVTENDRVMTLQTCVKHQEELRLVIIGKEINRIPIE
ncbi:MAG: class B sortase [Erysipelotrichaceae bacterium]|jgi:sortase B|nr:class B sortase [Erysipelotrichaceae bacterium]